MSTIRALVALAVLLSALTLLYTVVSPRMSALSSPVKIIKKR